MQIVYLSARPEVLSGTLGAVQAHLPFVDSVLAVVPRARRSEFADLGIDLLVDEELVPGGPPSDHSKRNFALRAALGSSAAVQDLFLMSDDDSRPLIGIPESTFVSERRYRRYTFGWVDEWTHRSTSFDRCQIGSRQVLALLGYERRAYASHMPQVIEKALMAQVAGVLEAAAPIVSLCEWNTYFNIAPHLAPERFLDPEPFLTLGWPENILAWQPTIEPAAFKFENFFGEHYAAGAVFEGIAPEDHSLAASLEKVVRWRHYELQLLDGARSPAVGSTPAMSSIGRSLRRVRAVTVGDPIKREREQRAAWSAMLRALRRS